MKRILGNNGTAGVSKGRKAKTRKLKEGRKATRATDDENDCVVTEKALTRQVSTALTKAKKNENDLLKNAWAAGDGLNKLRERFPHGQWMTYLKMHNPCTSDTTLDRYRAVAAKFPTVADLKKSGITSLMDAYRACNLVPEKGVSHDNANGGATSVKKAITDDERMIDVLSKATKHFDKPEKMAGPEKHSLKRVLVRLVEIFNKLDRQTFTWNEEESEMITALYESVQARKVEA